MPRIASTKRILSCSKEIKWIDHELWHRGNGDLVFIGNKKGKRKCVHDIEVKDN